MRRLYIPLKHEEFERLLTLALAQHRSPQAQAAVFVVRALQRQERAAAKAAGGRQEVANAS